MSQEPISDEQLESLLDLAGRATPRPWYVRRLDDDQAMNLIGISTEKDSGLHERFEVLFHGDELLAATLVQHPRYVCSADQKWDENADYIVAAVNVLPSLIEEIRELRRRLEEVERKIRRTQPLFKRSTPRS